MSKFGELINAQVPVLIDFYTEWNDSSVSMHPVIRDVAAALGDRAKVIKIDVDKKKRQILRKQRNKFVDNVLFFKSQKNNVELKKEIESFNKFYKETYILNDYSLNSICQNNSDNETKIKVKMFLQIVKSFK